MKNILVLTITLFLMCGSVLANVNKSGVNPSVLSLPSGPGSIEGLGETFNPQLNSGTASYSVPLKTLPGRNGFAPDLSLAYNSGNGNGSFGMGWKIEFLYIQRQTDKGIPFYTDYPTPDGVDNDNDGIVDEYDEYDKFILGGGEELVPVAGGFFRVENESSFMRFQKTDGWIGKGKNGSTLYFGTTASSRVSDGYGRNFKYYLDKMVDRNGNEIAFTYEKKDTGNQIYCTKIEYNKTATGSMTIEFSYEVRPDITKNYTSGFELKTAYRCNSIKMYESGNHVRSYRLNYAIIDAMQPLSMLASVTQIGRDEVSELPPAKFTYTSYAGHLQKVNSSVSALALNLNDSNIDLVDLNSDGLPDAIDTRRSPHNYYINKGPDDQGNIKWGEYKRMTPHMTAYLQDSSVRLADMDGDGKSELFKLSNGTISYYGIDNNLSWKEEGRLLRTEVSFSNPNVRLVDINNDKLIDVIQTGRSGYNCWINLKGGKWSNRITQQAPQYNLLFERSTTKLADMNGDRILDIVHFDNRSCYYFPGMGYGKFGSKVLMENSPRSFTDENKIMFADVNGDGLSDVVYVGSYIRVWLNNGFKASDHTKGVFSQEFTIYSGALNNFSAFRQADINGNGSIDIVCTVRSKIAYIDFMGEEHPYQLKTVNNGIGLTTTFDYKSSVKDMQTDRDSGTPWT
ncbi:MAG: hypothetical protein GY760_12080, partial [Deltaproteobacteria bacterium]|nr:hypothetical protein [Deltaproteobacteria bacterium]